MSYRPNVDAVQHLVTAVLPRIRREIPDVQLCIVGMDPTPAVRRLADEDRVVVTGRVDDVRPYFDSAAVAVAPLRVARGLQNKVLEAMAMRVPVVASPAAFEGISAVAGRDLLVAAGPNAFSRAVVTLLRDPAARERYAAAGRACVETNHNWSRLLQRLEDLVVGGDQLAAAATRPSSH
jgi:glycosyltransferase involved in cell wall biosynthesis